MARRVMGRGRRFESDEAARRMGTMNRRGKAVALSTAAAGVAVLVAAGFAMRKNSTSGSSRLVA